MSEKCFFCGAKLGKDRIEFQGHYYCPGSKGSCYDICDAICDHCKKVFVLYEGILDPDHVFCSQECADSFSNS